MSATLQTAEWYREHVTGPPIVHGNGFIQLPLDKGERLHVWHHELPKCQTTYTGIHDHRFGFVSKVLRGVLINRSWQAIPGDVYRVLRPGRMSEGEDEWQLFSTGETCTLTRGCDAAYGPGAYYSLMPRIFHESIPSTPVVVTLMTKTAEDRDHEPRILCPAGRLPDNQFRRTGHQNLWDLIENALRMRRVQQ